MTDDRPTTVDLSDRFPPIDVPAPKPPPITVASILDEFSDWCFRYEANLVRVTRDGWRPEIDMAKPALLLVESAWAGNAADVGRTGVEKSAGWRRLIANCGRTADNPLVELVWHCRARGIPTVFWNKEDPANFEQFIEAARQFDVVFTSDADSVGRYAKVLGPGRVFPLTFAAQPKIHNPAGKREHEDFEVGFAGSWYAHKFRNRADLLPMMINAASGRRLHIFDRLSDWTYDDRYRFPATYAPFLRRSLPYKRVVRAYKDFKVFLTVNSVIHSPTMFARRAVEVLACGTAVVSAPSLALRLLLGDVVSVVESPAEAREAITELLDNEEERRARAHRGWRRVMREHTYARRFRTICETIGIAPPRDDRPPVSVLLHDHPDGDRARLIESCARQTYPDLEVVVPTPSGGASRDGPLVSALGRAGVRRVQEVLVDRSDDVAAVMVSAARIARGRYLAVFDARDVYDPDYLWDLVTAFSYIDAPVVAKPPPGRPGQAFEPAAAFGRGRWCSPRAMLCRTSFLGAVGAWDLVGVDDEPMLVLREGDDAGGVYYVDPHGYGRR